MAEQRETFDEVADLYERTRPQVPGDALLELWEQCAVEPGQSVLEIGCGTGQLTKHLLAYGCEVTCVEPGESLADACERQHGGPSLTVERSTFEAWDPGERMFHLVTACQAAHWIEPYEFLDRASEMMHPRGHLGLLWHLDTSEGTEFWEATQHLYDRYLPDADDKPPKTIPLHVAAYVEAIRDDARFLPSDRKEVIWRRRFDEETYLGWLLTNSPVRMLSEEDRAAFIQGHTEVIQKFGGEVERMYETVLISTRLDEY